MFKQILAISITGLITVLTTPAMAHSYSSSHNHNAEIIYPITHPAPNHHAQKCVWNNNVNQRQANQRMRINNGIKSGQLTQWEAQQLKSQQQRIKRAEQGMLRSGNCLDRTEVSRLDSMLDDANRYIRSLKHNHIIVQQHHHHRNGGQRPNHR